jgi:hypothetical protein
MVIWKGGADVPRYVCTNGKNGSGLCAYESIIGTQFEEWILDAVGCHLEEDARKEERQGPDVKPFEQQIVKLKRERTKVEADLKAARRGLLLLPEGEDRAPYVAEIREMEAQAATITDQIASNERQIASARQRREEVWRLAQDWTARVTRAVHGRHTVQLPGGYLTDESISDEEYDRMMESISDLTPLTQGEQDRERIEIKNLLRRLVERIVVNMETRRFTVTFLDGEEIDGEILDLTLHGGDGDMIEVDD